MSNQKISRAVRIVALLLTLALMLPIGAMAAESRSSLYLHSYSAYIYPAGWGKVQVWFDITGAGDMDEIGVLNIKLYESKDQETWTWVDAFHFSDYDGMLGYDNYTHSGHIEYNGTIGRYYQAYVCVWAGKDGGGDTRYFWTPVKKATLFAG